MLPADPAETPRPDAPPRAEPIPYRAEVIRKLLHLVALVVPFGMALAGRRLSVIVLVPLAVLAVAADVLRVRASWFARFVGRFFGWMMRAEEQPPVGGPVVLNGATWVLVSAALLVIIFPLRIAVAAFVMFILSDAAAALVGRRYGRHLWGGGPRTVEGSFAFVVTGLAVMALYPGMVLWIAAVSVVAAAGAEVLRGPFNDNLRVPIVAAAIIFVLERYALGLSHSLFL